MLFSEEAVQFQCPVFESGLTVDDLLSLLQQPENSASQNSGSAGSEGSNRAYRSVDERKRRRMISNRESARRSRWRKKRHLEGLTAQLNRMRLENREFKNRLGLLAQRCHVALRENDRLVSELVALQSRFSHLLRILDAMQYSNQ